jgi:chromate transport protein ChrA
VGVILNLALVFGSAVLWQAGEIHWQAFAMAAIALFSLVRWHVDVLWVVLMGGGTGWLLSQVGQS